MILKFSGHLAGSSQPDAGDHDVQCNILLSPTVPHFQNIKTHRNCLFVVLRGDAVWISVLKMETVSFSETLVSTYFSTWRHNPEEQHRHLHRREIVKSHTLQWVLADFHMFK
jgi:hypothetical protein